jgi:ABC-type branched-subunit amino acid transport system substrate-binding protein
MVKVWRWSGLVMFAALVVMAVGCSSSGKPGSSRATSGSTTAGGSGGHRYTIGVLADETGLGASSNKSVAAGVQAGIALAKRAGYQIEDVVVDTTSSPGGTLAGAQRLVEQDHVSVVIEAAVFSYAASPFLKAQNIPVIGQATTSEWTTDLNMFGVTGPLYAAQPTTAFGKFMRMEGATNVAALAYSLIPNSAGAVKALGTSAVAAGLKAGFLDGQFPLGSTNVEPTILQMKSAGIDGFTADVDPNTGFALITSARQAGVNLKVAFLPTGYGGDLLQSGPGALDSAQNVYFETAFQPVEMDTVATRRFEADLRSAGVAAEPSYGQYVGYAAMTILVDGLKASGGNATSSALISGIDSLKTYDAGGLLGQRIDLGQRGPISAGIDNCFFATRLVGSKFQLISGADPLCGTPITGAG